MLEITLIGYYIVALIYMVVQWRRDDRDLILIALMVLFIPFFGLLLSLLREMAGKMENSSETSRFSDLIERNQREDNTFEKINVKRETNRAPLEEVLLINDLATRRRLLLDVLKEDMDDTITPLLQHAASNEDTETSHYAVTALMEIKRKMLLEIQKWSVQYERESNDPHIMLHYANAIQLYMLSGFMDSRMQMSHRLTYVKLLDHLLNTELKSENVFAELILSEIELGRYDEGLRYSKLFRQSYPDNEDAYLATLNLYYSLRMKDSFYETLEELKVSKIRVSNTGLNVIRYWSVKGA
ncbi:hypothetical protein [Paenibacillus sp. CMAA1364]